MVDPKKKFSLVKPTIQTPFHIDFAWWRQNDRDWRVYLRSYLSQEDQAAFSGHEEELFDIIDPTTAEVHQVDGLQHLLITKYAKHPDFIGHNQSVTESVFRLLLASGNSPMTPLQLAEKLGKPPETILQTLTGGRVYKGVRACPES